MLSLFLYMQQLKLIHFTLKCSQLISHRWTRQIRALLPQSSFLGFVVVMGLIQLRIALSYAVILYLLQIMVRKWKRTKLSEIY